jgi:hypothetical protein
MLSIGISQALNRKKIQTIGNPYTNLLRTKQGRINWELKNYSELEKILTRWQKAVFIMAQSQVFTEGLYDFFSKRRNDLVGFDSAMLKDVLLYIRKEYGNYLRKDISAEDLHFIRSVDKEIQQGVNIERNRIFPTVYYPYMDKQYFDHSNWNKIPTGISISDVLFRKKINSIIHTVDEQESKSGCNSNCNCSSNSSSKKPGYNSQNENFLETLKIQAKMPILYVGYSDINGHTGYYLNSDCGCQIQYGGLPGDTLQAPRCKSDGRGQFCGKQPCSSAPCTTADSQIPR